MKRTIILTLLAIFISTMAMAQDQDRKAERERWKKQMRDYKIEFVAKELNLTPEQKTKFAPIYESLCAEIDKMRSETNRMVRNINKRAKAREAVADLEYIKAAEAAFEADGKESAIKLNYIERLKSVLSPRQLFLLPKVERDFNRHIIKEHQKHKDKKK